jgi:ribosomal protein L21E
VNKTTKQEYLNQLNKVLEYHRSGKPVEIESIPALFRNDFNHFFNGETLQAINGKIVIGPNKYKEWIIKLRNIGLDYEIPLENS